MPVVTYSSLTAFRACPQRYYWEYVRKIRPEKEARSLVLGRAIHDVLAEIYKGRPLESAIATASHHSLEPTDVELVQALCKNYCEHWACEDDAFRTARIVQVEEHFQVALHADDGLSIDLSGRPDLVLEADIGRSTGSRRHVVIVDHKTTAESRSPLDARLTASDQLKLYAVALQRLGFIPVGAIYNVLSTKLPRLPRINRDGSLHRGFCDTTPQIYELWMRRTGCMGAPWADNLELLRRRDGRFFYRLEVRLDKAGLEQVSAEAVATACAILKSTKENYWPRREDACFDGFGPCPFHAMCFHPSREQSSALAGGSQLRHCRLNDVRPPQSADSALGPSKHPGPVSQSRELAPRCAQEPRPLQNSLSGTHTPYRGGFDSGDEILCLAVTRRLGDGKNVFLTGPAGTGKTYFVKKVANKLAESGKVVQLTASTGLGASHMSDLVAADRTTFLRGPQTLHSAAFLPWSTHPDTPGHLARGTSKLADASVVVVDEISMLDRITFERFMARLRSGTSVLAVGDFFQLPPVNDDECGDPEFAFRSPLFSSFEVIELTRVYRQEDPEFVHILDQLRHGMNSSSFYLGIPERFEEGHPILYGTNREADERNKLELSKLQVQSRMATAFPATGPRDGALKWFAESVRAPQTLELKIGMRAMCVQNMQDVGLVNGDLGTVTKLSEEEWENSGPEWVDVDFDRLGPKRVFRFPFEKHVWIGNNRQIEFRVFQIPLVAAYGLTVHKSQGMTLEIVNIDANRVNFAAGQVYVALSRCRSKAGLRIRNSAMFQAFTRPEVEAYYANAHRFAFDKPAEIEVQKRRVLPERTGSSDSNMPVPLADQCAYCQKHLAEVATWMDVTLYKIRRHWLRDTTRSLKNPVLDDVVKMGLPLCDSCARARRTADRYTRFRVQLSWTAFLVGLLTSGLVIPWPFGWGLVVASAATGLALMLVLSSLFDKLRARRLRLMGADQLPPIAAIPQVQAWLNAGWELTMPPNTKVERVANTSCRRGK